jgi:hypothetical protein
MASVLYKVEYPMDSLSFEVLDEACEGLDLILVPGAYSWSFKYPDTTKRLFIQELRLIDRYPGWATGKDIMIAL